MNICLFDESELGKPISIKDERAQHILKILHKKEGDDFFAGIIGQSSGTAKILKITDENLFFEFTDFQKEDLRPLFPLVMIVGFPRPIQLKRLLRDVAALGICEIHLTGTELGEKSYLNSNLAQKENVYQMLLDGTVQAGATKIPEIFIHKNLKNCIDVINERSLVQTAGKNSTLKISLDNKSPCGSLDEILKNNIQNNCEEPALNEKNSALAQKHRVVAAIGSERGWTDKERDLFTKNGYILCGMGNRIMRTETAATVAGAIILNHLGALK